MGGMIAPYYQANGITIYHGDAREILSHLPDGIADAVITDPVWPNAPAGLYAGADDPAGLFAVAAAQFPRLAQRVVVQMGCNSDPRILQGIPPALPFLRVCWLEYAVPGRMGRVLYSGDVAYVYGVWPSSRSGQHLFPGRGPKAQPHRGAHPTPRALEHVAWLVRWYARGLVLDPFAGGGTTLCAAKAAGLPAIGIEISKAYCDAAVEALNRVHTCQERLDIDVLEAA